MNCDCIQNTADILLPKLRESNPVNPKKGAITSVQCGNIGLNFKTGETMLGIPFRIRFEKQRKEDDVLIYAYFCPFCGVSTKATGGEQ